MFPDKALAARYFSFFSSRHARRDETQKELRLGFQAFIFNYQHNYYTTSEFGREFKIIFSLKLCVLPSQHHLNRGHIC